MDRAYSLLTGGTGFVAGNLLNSLSKDKIISLIRHSSRQVVGTQLMYGDITKENCGLKRESVKFLGNYCKRIIHCAADINFDSTTNTNIEGAKNLINLAKLCNIEEFHHLSTAYVCGKRTGIIYEHELDEGQTFKNRYEHAKCATEVLIKSSGLNATIYRPAIIVGDSKTGETSSFRTFYTLVKFAAEAAKLGQKMDLSNEFLRVNLSGYERANIVPIDWVCSVINKVLSMPAALGLTYHIVPSNVITTSDISRAICQYFKLNDVKYIKKRDRNALLENLSRLEEYFYSTIQTYINYWGEEVQFNDNNTRSIMSNECVIDSKCLERLIDYAVKINFHAATQARDAA